MIDAKKDRIEHQKAKVKKDKGKATAALFFKPMSVVPVHIVEENNIPAAARHRWAQRVCVCVHATV